MTQEEIIEEIVKCRESPYYFVTKYIKVKNHHGEFVSLTIPLTEKEFNKMFKDYEARRNH